MKQLKQPETAASGAVNWQVEFNKLRAQHIALQRAFIEMQSPTRDAEATERNFRSVERFVTSMSDAEGIVVCANIYNSTWFTEDADPAYARRVCKLFVDTFKSVASLAEPTYALWLRLATA